MAAKVNSESCTGCGCCVGECPVSAIVVENDIAVISADDCVDCGACVGACPVSAITL